MRQMTNQKKALQIANKLKQVRVEMGISQVEAAILLSTNQSYISRCETGKRRLDIFELNEFCKIYKKPISYFLEE